VCENDHSSEWPVLIVMDGEVGAEARPDAGGYTGTDVLDGPIQAVTVRDGEEVLPLRCRLLSKSFRHRDAEVH
jgi:hypothetical protein